MPPTTYAGCKRARLDLNGMWVVEVLMGRAKVHLESGVLALERGELILDLETHVGPKLGGWGQIQPGTSWGGAQNVSCSERFEWHDPRTPAGSFSMI